MQAALKNLQAALKGSLASCCPPSEALAARPSQPTGSAADAAPAAAAPTQVRSCVRRLSATLLVNHGMHVAIQIAVCGCLFAKQAGAAGGGAEAAPAYRRTPSIEAALAAELPDQLHGAAEKRTTGTGRVFYTHVGLGVSQQMRHLLVAQGSACATGLSAKENQSGYSASCKPQIRQNGTHKQAHGLTQRQAAVAHDLVVTWRVHAHEWKVSAANTHEFSKMLRRAQKVLLL